jgi:tRNA-2-methylthio-N6-dimethylallyladenosine synthase
MAKYYIWTIGCQMNKVESERLAGYLENKGYAPATDAETADLILINSCVVRQSAENRVINKLHALRAVKKAHPEAVIGLTGCIVSPDNGRLKQNFPFIDYIFPAGDFPAWLGHAEAIQTLPSRSSVSECVPIMQGCNNFCSYCIVPYRRGRERSRSPEEIVREVQELVSRGAKEVTLLGQNVDSYGHDLPVKPDLAALLNTLNPLEGLLRIRFLTNHPKDMGSGLLDTVAGLDKVCEQINLPVQAGDDTVLRGMRRGYTVEHYCSLIKEIRAKIPEIALSTDVIVGFPGETPEQFENTYNLLAGIRFDVVHTAVYSPRPGTLAAREMHDDIPRVVKQERREKIEKLQAQIAGEINRQLLDKTVEVLVEGQEKGKWYGRTRSDKLVFFTDEVGHPGQLVKVKITHTSPWSLSGERSF